VVGRITNSIRRPPGDFNPICSESCPEYKEKSRLRTGSQGDETFYALTQGAQKRCEINLFITALSKLRNRAGSLCQPIADSAPVCIELEWLATESVQKKSAKNGGSPFVFCIKDLSGQSLLWSEIYGLRLEGRQETATSSMYPSKFPNSSVDGLRPQLARSFDGSLPISLPSIRTA
jgi:hypothetical protein